MRSVRPPGRAVSPRASTKKTVGGKRSSPGGRSYLPVEVGSLLCFVSIFFSIVGLSAGSVTISGIGVIAFILGYLLLRYGLHK